jgi:CRP-like cAMP-binding protein
MDKKQVRRTTDTKKIISLLKRTPIFAQVSEETLESMLKSTIQKTVEAGAKIVEQGKEGIGFYLILEGKAEVVKGTVKLGELQVGDFFGELACIDGEPRTADVVAVTDTTCLVITQWGMNSIIESCPGVALGMLKELVSRLRSSNAALHTS